MTSLPRDLTAQSRALAAGETSAVTLTEAALAVADAHASLNIFAALTPKVALAQARASDARRAAGQTLGPLDGLPLAVKDNYLTADYPTTACSNALPDPVPGADARMVANLRAAGMVILGKTNMHEWAYGATNDTSTAGATRNPRDPAHITGGSSGGSGAAVAAGVVGAALGSDTGGSVRIPAAACGVYGFKPGYGRASRAGILPLSWSLDAPGPLAASLSDIALVLPHMLGADADDIATRTAQPFRTVNAPTAPRLIHLTGKGLERSDSVDRALRGWLDTACARSGAQVTEAGLPDIARYFAAWDTIMHAEASSYHADRLARAPQEFSEMTRIHLEAGLRLSAVQLLAAQRLRHRLIRTLLQDLGPWDALVLPTLPVPVPRHGVAMQEFGGRRVTTQDSMTWFCWLGNLAGLPAVTLPIPPADSQAMPFGMMLMGRPGGDEALLQIARQMDPARDTSPAAG